MESSTHSKMYKNEKQVYEQLGSSKSEYQNELVKSKEDKKLYMMKRIKINKISEQQWKEIEILTQLNHENIFKYQDIFLSSTKKGENNDTLVLITEYVKLETLENYLTQYKQLDEEKILKFFLQICLGLRYLHSKNIIHKNLRPNKIIIFGNQLKIMEYGLSLLNQDQNQNLQSIEGALAYSAPEHYLRRVFGQRKNYQEEKSMDIWSLGSILYRLCTNKDLYYIKEFNIKKQLPQRKMSQFFKNLLLNFLQFDKNKRINLNDAIIELYLKLQKTERSSVQRSINQIIYHQKQRSYENTIQDLNLSINSLKNENANLSMELLKAKEEKMHDKSYDIFEIVKQLNIDQQKSKDNEEKIEDIPLLLNYDYIVEQKVKVLYIYDELTLQIEQLEEVFEKMNKDVHLIDFQQEYSQINQILIDPYDSILIDVEETCIQLKKIQQLANQAIMQGKTVVFINCCNFSQSNQNNFKSPLNGGPDDTNFPSWNKIYINHPLFKQVEFITAPSDPDQIKRCLVEVNKNKNIKVDIIAEYEDKIPMIAIRYDQKGFIIQINYYVGDEAITDGINLIVNALTFFKKK